MAHAVLGQLDLEGGGTTFRETTVTTTSQHGATSQNTLRFVKTAVRTYSHSWIFRQAFQTIVSQDSDPLQARLRSYEDPE